LVSLAVGHELHAKLLYEGQDKFYYNQQVSAGGDESALDLLLLCSFLTAAYELFKRFWVQIYFYKQLKFEFLVAASNNHPFVKAVFLHFYQVIQEHNLTVIEFGLERSIYEVFYLDKLIFIRIALGMKT